MKKIILINTLFLGSFMFAQKVGGDRDAHGCIGSAGYTYSQVKKDCIRTFEQKVKLTEVNPKASYTSMTAVVFSDDMKKAEVFLPEQESGSLILTRAKKGKAWKNGKYALVSNKKTGYKLKKDNVVIYQ
ncbi:hypothetical protein D1631_12625 [Chryseobacterium nematophagum]|uniref:Uncharacterized protein n=1 Tax=Chryseobacterium nematophagum TaxID=2305228 RepID=A0A3M7TJ80_9FLAO|nr:hypothetical protein [Chryseobacterium nematophagum]RNA62719.1 hypothetical protein D1631_12625 [Chryseobacterium nematophagum]